MFVVLDWYWRKEIFKVRAHVLHANYVIGKKKKLEALKNAMQFYL